MTVNGDLRGEPDETFFREAVLATGAVITDGTGLGTIVNDDTSLAVDDVTVAEGDSGTKQATFTVGREPQLAPRRSSGRPRTTAPLPAATTWGWRARR